jgi:hypothetical protein
MQDMKRRLDQLRDEAAECAITSGLADTKEKRELFARLAKHLNSLADDVERTIAAAETSVGRKQEK